MAEAAMTMYEMAKQMVANEKPMDPIVLNQSVLEMASEFSDHEYVMLLCAERKDYSIFHINESNTRLLATELAETLCNRGNVLLADRQPDGAYEIWIRDFATEENFAYYLFDYSMGIIEVG